MPSKSNHPSPTKTRRGTVRAPPSPPKKRAPVKRSRTDSTTASEPPKKKQAPDVEPNVEAATTRGNRGRKRGGAKGGRNQRKEAEVGGSAPNVRCVTNPFIPFVSLN